MKNLSFWLKFSIFNLTIVAALGVLMRYKIAFAFPFLEQKFIQESHSHFAFYGWITSCIYVLIAKYLTKVSPNLSIKKYKILIATNLVASFGMLICFICGGYFWLSIAFSTVALFTSFGFFYFLLNDLKDVENIAKNWFLAGFFFAMLSSLGVFALSYMMATKHISQDFYLASQYFYLHFQYNGFFIFSCIGFLVDSLREAGAKISEKENKTIFRLLFFGCFAGFGLSVLWMKLPIWIFLIIILATVSQTYGAVKIFLLVKNNWRKLSESWQPIQKFILLYAGFAFGVKILLQLGSNIPAINQFAFGFRNIVIAYLHLILLMCISAFLVGQILGTHYFKISKNLLNGVKLFLASVFLNELILGFMGIFSIKYIAIPFANEMLFAVSCFILLSTFMIFFNLKKKQH